MSQERLVALAVVFTMALGVSLTLNPAVLPLYSVALAVLACAAVPYLLHAHPSYSFSPPRMMVPAALALAAPSAAHALSGGPFMLVGVFAPGALLFGVILAEYLLVRPSNVEAAQHARLMLTLAAYAVALTFFLLIYQGKERTLIAGTETGAVSAALVLRLLTLDRQLDVRTWWYAAVAGLVMVELLWPLNYWLLGVTAGGLALLLAFYLLAGVMRQFLAGKLTSAMLVEYGTVALAGLTIVFGASRV